MNVYTVVDEFDGTSRTVMVHSTQERAIQAARAHFIHDVMACRDVPDYYDPIEESDSDTERPNVVYVVERRNETQNTESTYVEKVPMFYWLD